MPYSKRDIQKMYQHGEHDRPWLGIKEYFVPGIGWTNRCMTGEVEFDSHPILTADKWGIFAAVMDGAEKVQFVVANGINRNYPDFAISELTEQFD